MNTPFPQFGGPDMGRPRFGPGFGPGFGFAPAGRGHRRGRRDQVREHLREHGAYPVVLPPKRPDGLLPLVPVAAPNAVFLVESSERAHFCAALLSGREPGPSRRGRALFRRSGVGAAVGTPWRVFCEKDREPHVAIPGLDR